MKLTPIQLAYFRKQTCDTALHVLACGLADDEAFRIYGTDSISDQHVLWPRWLELYDQVIKQVYPAKTVAK